MCLIVNAYNKITAYLTFRPVYVLCIPCLSVVRICNNILLIFT